MNPILRSYCKQIDTALAALGEAMSTQATAVREQREAREKLLKEYWSRGRQLATLQEDRAQFEHLQAQNERMKAREDALREHLRSVLNRTKALVEGMRS